MNFLASLLSIEPSALGPSEWVYLFVVGAVVLGSFAFLARPFVNLSLAIFYLASANTYILGTTVSAILAAVLIANCLVGTALAYGLKLPLPRHSLYVPLLLIAIAIFGALYGFFRGNRTAWVLGDA